MASHIFVIYAEGVRWAPGPAGIQEASWSRDRSRAEQGLHVPAGAAEPLVHGRAGEAGLVTPLGVVGLEDRVPVRGGHVAVQEQLEDGPGGRDYSGPVAPGIIRACRNQGHQHDAGALAVESFQHCFGKDLHVHVVVHGNGGNRGRRGCAVLAAVGEHVDVFGRDGGRAPQLVVDLADQRYVEETAQVLDGVRTLPFGDGADGLLHRILGQFPAAGASYGPPQHLGIDGYSREIFMETHDSPSGWTSRRCRPERSVAVSCLISFALFLLSGAGTLRHPQASRRRSGATLRLFARPPRSCAADRVASSLIEASQ